MQLLAKQRQLIVPERTRGQRSLLRRLDQRREDRWVTVSLVYSRVGRQEIEITLSVAVVHPGTTGSADDNIERLVVVCSVLVFQSNQFLAEFWDCCDG